MNKVFGVFAHVDAGKTTFSERLLYNAGALRNIGSVDKGNTMLDYHSVEKRRGITVYGEEASFIYDGDTYFLADTPGHEDFSAQVLRTLNIIDYAVLIVDGVRGIQQYTQTVWNQLRRRKIPVFIFINKTDLETAQTDVVLTKIKGELSENAVLFSDKESLAETVSLYDETLFEKFTNDTLTDSDIIEVLPLLIKKREIFPVFCGSALKNDGIDEFMSAFCALTFTDYDKNGDFRAIVYKIRRIENDRIGFMKVLSGEAFPRMSIATADGVQKINQFRRYAGAKFLNCDKAVAGELCAFTGLSKCKSGDIIGKDFSVGSEETVPVIKLRVVCDDAKKDEVFKALILMQDEEPTLNTKRDENGNINISTLGEIQSEIILDELSERFALEVSFDAPTVIYRETISEPVMGCGHYEPLKHYAEVHLRLVPSEGISFESECSFDVLDKSLQNLIKTHIFEKKHKGVLTGSEIDNIKFVLTAGAQHLKHTSGGDFREAVYRAVRQGLMKAKSVLLEPFYSFQIECLPEATGKVAAFLTLMNSTYEPFEVVDGLTKIRGHFSVAEYMKKAMELKLLLKGVGDIFVEYGGYFECLNTDLVVREANYLAENDLENSADSVFCSHGAGFLVKWDKADEYMHIKE